MTDDKPVNMGEPFRALPLDTLIGRPLAAVHEAQIKLAEAAGAATKNVDFDKIQAVQSISTHCVRDEDDSETPK